MKTKLSLPSPRPHWKWTTVLLVVVLLVVAMPVNCLADKQDKGAVGAGLLTGGAAVIVGLGTFGFGGVLFGAFGAGFQVGYGGGMIAKSVSEAPKPNPNFNQPVVVSPLTIAPLAGTGLAAANLSTPANAAMQDIAVFDANIRAFGTARERYLSALSAGDSAAAASQLTSASQFYTSAFASLHNTAEDLLQLQTALGTDPVGGESFDVATLYSSEQSDLINNGFPASEQSHLLAFQVNSTEQSLFVSRLAGISSADAVGYYGSTIDVQDLVGEIASNASDIDANLSSLLNFRPVPEPSSTLALLGIDTLSLLAYDRQRKAKARAQVGLS